MKKIVVLTLLLLVCFSTISTANLPSFEGVTIYDSQKRNAYTNHADLNSAVQKIDAVLTQYTVVDLDIHAVEQYVKANQTQASFYLNLGNKQVRLNLSLHDILSADFKHYESSPNGMIVHPKPEAFTYRGYTDNPSDKNIALAIRDKWMSGFFTYQNEVYFLTPLKQFDTSYKNNNSLVLYAASDSKYTGFDCNFGHSIPQSELPSSKDSSPSLKNNTVVLECVEMAVAYDQSFKNFHGGVQGVQNIIISRLNMVASQYTNWFDLDYTLLELYETANNEVTPDNNLESCLEVFPNCSENTVLDDFREWGEGQAQSPNFGNGFNSNPDVATFWTDRNLESNGSSGNIGYAHFAGICNERGYNICEDFTSNESTLVTLWAHELGHNWNAFHNNSSSNNLMNGTIGAGTIVANSTLNSIADHKASRTCLDNGACGSSSCNDGIQNGNETGIDCGGSCPACPTCNDGVLNGDEIGIDCGGPDCPACPPENCSTVNFNANPILGYDATQDLGTAAIQDGGATIFLQNNAWKAIQINYNVSTNTVLEFDFKATVQGEIHDIGFDDNLSFDTDGPPQRFVLYGTQNYCGSLNGSDCTPYDGSGNWQSFTLPIGASFTGFQQYLVFTADDDSNQNPLGDSYFRNIKIYEDYNGDQICGNGNNPTCTDGIQNGNETGVDCGGSDCPACPTCFDGVQNGNETDIDCGGSCPACPTCFDGILNGDEIGIDCGGSDCPACPSEDCTTYNFSTNTINSYDATQDFGTATVQDGGATLLIEGNVWKAIEINYTLTPNTVLEFDFKSTAQGEIHDIGFDNDLIFAPVNRAVVYGNQGYTGDYAITPYNGSGNFQHFVIPLGISSPVTYQYMVLTADDDANANANSYFRNIQIYEDYDGNLTCGSGPTCTDGLQNGNETGIDCGGSDCPPCSTSITLDICVFLEGPYNISTGIMDNTLQSLGLLAAQPYNQPPWNYNGSEGVGWTASDYPAGSVDWVLVSFRTGIAANTEIAQAAAIVQQDGCLYFPNENVLSANNAGNPLYVVIEHRNHIGAMTPQAVQIVNNTMTYDFRSADSYKDNASFGQKQLSNGTWAMFAGDADQSAPQGYEITGLDKSVWASSNGVFDGYFIPDFNQDGDVNGGDKSIWLSNNGISSAVPK